MKPSSVVVATDFSEASVPALRWGATVASRTHASLRVLNVALMAEASALYPLFDVSSDTEGLFDRIHRHAERGLASFLEGNPPPDGVTYEPVVQHASSAAAGVLEHLHERGGDLLVVGTHGRRGFRRWLMGSVTEEILRRVRCPVLCCPAHDGDIAPSRVLAAVDLSEASVHVVEAAKEMADLLGAGIDLGHAIPDPLVPIHASLLSGVGGHASPSRAARARSRRSGRSRRALRPRRFRRAPPGGFGKAVPGPAGDGGVRAVRTDRHGIAELDARRRVSRWRHPRRAPTRTVPGAGRADRGPRGSRGHGPVGSGLGTGLLELQAAASQRVVLGEGRRQQDQATAADGAARHLRRLVQRRADV